MVLRGQGGDRGPALTSGTFTHGSGDADLFRSIRSGVRGTQMAPFPGLSDTQIWQLVAYRPQPSVRRRLAVAASTSSGLPERSRGAMPPLEKRCSPAVPRARAVTK